MVFKLAKNAHKGRWGGLGMLRQQALMALEVTELNEAIEGGNTVDVLLEAADVANFAMIISSLKVDGDD